MKDDDYGESSQLKLLFSKNDPKNRKTQDNNKGWWKGTNDKGKGNQNGKSSNIKEPS